MTCTAVAGGGAWNRDDGGYYFKIGLTSLSADDQYGLDGDHHPFFEDTINYSGANFGVTDIALYGEYGFTSWLTGVASTQYKVAVRQAHNQLTKRDTTASASGLSDLWLSGRVRLIPAGGPYVATITLGVKLPTGSPLQQIPLGSGVLDYEIALTTGGSFPMLGMNAYAQLSGGYRIRNSLANELNYLAEMGLHLSSEFMLQGVFDGSHSTADFDRAASDPGTVPAGLLIFSQSFSRLMVGITYGVNEGMDLNVGYGGYLSGRNAIAGSGLNFGVVWKW
ncbi:MAG: hypothetical protein ABIR47_05525 [Candidatus Kapaibacterium sp.]